MPRISVDIDVAFTNHTVSRNEALKSIRQELQSLGERLELSELARHFGE